MSAKASVFPQRLRDARERAGLTQSELGERVSLSLRQYHRYEAGQSVATGDHLSALARELAVTVDWLLGLVDNPAGHFDGDSLSATEYQLIKALREDRIQDALYALARVSDAVKTAKGGA